MPTYHARGVSAHLGAMPLADTITPDIVLRKGGTAKQQCETAEKTLLDSKLLSEERVIFPGDVAGLELNWLGNAPFMQVQAGRCLFRSEDEEDARVEIDAAIDHTAYRRRRARPFADNSHNDNKPQALSLHIKLSDKTFVSGIDNLKTHLKIEVFFNGQLASCLFLPTHDVRSGTKSLHQVFAGTRIDFLAERPWIILPPGVTEDGRGRRSSKALSVQQRWQQICQALQKEADERGIDKNKRVPPSAEFLSALAKMQMPAEVGNMQKPGGRHFGVIDVVISAGDGRKVTSGTSYLQAPQRLADKNFPLAIGGNSEAEQSHMLVNEEGGEESGAFTEPSPELIDVDAEGESDLDYEPQPKRQALASCVRSQQPMPETSSRPHLRNASIGMQVRSIPSPGQAVPRSSTSSAAAEFPPRFAPPVVKNGSRHGLSSSPERGRTYEENDIDDEHKEEAWGFRSASNGTAQSFYSQLNSSGAFPHTPQMRPSPYSFQFSDPMLGRDLPSGLMSLTSFTNWPGSSPLQRIPEHIDGSYFRPAFSPATRAVQTPQAMFGSSPFTAHNSFAEQARRSSFDSVNAPPFLRTAHLGHTMSSVGAQGSGVPIVHGNLPGMSPHAPHPLEFHSPMPFANYSCPPPYNQRSSAPLPPTGFFTVPTKPKRSVSPQKDPRLIGPDKPRTSMLVNRLKILGKDGTTVVDQCWPTPQRVAVKVDIANANQSPLNLPVRSSEQSAGPVDYVELAIGPRRSGRSTVKMNSSSSTLPVQIDNSVLTTCPDLTQRDAPHQGQTMRKPPNPESINPAFSLEKKKRSLLTEQNTVVEATGVSRQGPINASLTAIEQPAPQRRVTSGTDILGVRGSKASTFWREDPEEILREAARLRRSKFPTKQKKAHAVAPQPNTTTLAVNSLEPLETVASSPLSSAPNSPKPETEPAPKGDACSLRLRALSRPNLTSTREVAKLPHNTADSMAQLDGSREHNAMSAPRLSFQKIAPTLVGSTATPQFQAPAQPTPNTSLSLDTKKRKAPNRRLPRHSRSPDRLKTVGNPPLNRDCVIAFAESEDKGSKQGVLRQVRGERQGVFQEDYVVFAARFFVAVADDAKAALAAEKKKKRKNAQNKAESKKNGANKRKLNRELEAARQEKTGGNSGKSQDKVEAEQLLANQGLDLEPFFEPPLPDIENEGPTLPIPTQTQTTANNLNDVSQNGATNDSDMSASGTPQASESDAQSTTEGAQGATTGTAARRRHTCSDRGRC